MGMSPDHFEGQRPGLDEKQIAQLEMVANGIDPFTAPGEGPIKNDQVVILQAQAALRALGIWPRPVSGLTSETIPDDEAM